jgi:hypothetical protein
MRTSNKTPNPDRVYAVISKILERRHGVTIEYTITKIDGGTYEQHHH